MVAADAEWIVMMELETIALRAAPASGVHEGALVSVTFDDGAHERGRDVAR